MISLKSVKLVAATSFVAIVCGLAAMAGGTTGTHPYNGTTPINTKLCNKGLTKNYECNGNTGACMAATPTDKCSQICLDGNFAPTNVKANIKWIQCIDAN
ncbi:MAG: hypothetical protein HZA52_05900 [Planctomycetes bacterium]|nr:hypothetical protein [Planctomycetota bacterium]